MRNENINLIIKILKQIASVLHECDDKNWLPAFRKFIDQLSNNPKNEDKLIVLREIMGMYGGMGSFNDLVLFDKGKVCYKENKLLDELRKALYEQCKSAL
jgi:hypothetical protein